MNRQPKQSSLNTFQDLWHRFKAGDEAAFKELFYEVHADMCQYGTGICQQEDWARDSILELFLHLWISRTELPDVLYVKAYLFKALRNRLFKRLQQESRYQLREFQPEDEELEFAFSPEELITQSEQFQLQNASLSKALEELPPREREVIWLKYYEEFDYRQIADMMGIAYQSVMNYLHQGMRRLRKNNELKKALEVIQ